jgi:hypothetical protein
MHLCRIQIGKRHNLRPANEIMGFQLTQSFSFSKIKSIDLLVKIMYFSRHAKVPREKSKVPQIGEVEKSLLSAFFELVTLLTASPAWPAHLRKSR